jgi:ABC-2 type transport system permease protein
MGDPIGNSGLLAVVWSVGIAVIGYLWASRLFNRDPSR